VKRAIGAPLALGAKLARALISPEFRSVAGIFLGGLAVAAGAALIYAPAGLILGGAELVAYCLVLIDVDRKER
jgi:hypothetical protein